ncbi:MAG: aspartate/glutamate racemase family protein [Candidatus Eiseniibacteriota bacterium]
MKTIGVLGGMGPQATMDFEWRLHRAAQRAIPPSANRGYPPMVVYYVRHPPAILEADRKPRMPLAPDPRMLEAARRLGGLADFLVIPSNFTHVFQPQIEHAAGRDVLSMVDLVPGELRARRWTRVGVVGVGLPIVYTDRLDAIDVTHETLAPEHRAALDASILSVMEGRETDASRSVAHEAITTLRGRGVDGTILGCTEIPLLLGAAAESPDLLNPLELLAHAAVARAIA